MSFEQPVARQAGVITLGQAVECGMSAATVQRRTRQGSWERLYPAVYLVGGHRLDDEARVRAAALWAGPAAAVSGPAAAYWHGLLSRAPPEVEVTVPRRQGPGAQVGAQVRRRDLYPVDLAGIRGLRLTALPLTVLETAAVLPDGSAFLDRALQRRVRLPTAYRAYCRNMGRRGSSAAGRLLVAAADRADSAAERLLVRILREAGITGWVLGHPFGPWRVDLAFPGRRVAVEVDGWAWHVDPELSQPPDTATFVREARMRIGPRLTAAIRNDRRKQNALVGEHWLVLRFTWHDLDQRPAAVVAEICAALGVR